MPGLSQLILVVESDPAFRDLAASALRAAGYRALLAQSYEIALVLLEQDLPIELLIVETSSFEAEQTALFAARALTLRRDLNLLVSGIQINSLPPPLDGAGRLTRPYREAELIAATRELLGPPRIVQN